MHLIYLLLDVRHAIFDYIQRQLQIVIIALDIIKNGMADIQKKIDQVHVGVELLIVTVCVRPILLLI